MKVAFIKDEIWPDYVPFKDGSIFRADISVEMTETELIDYEAARDAYFNWRRVIANRLEGEE